MKKHFGALILGLIALSPVAHAADTVRVGIFPLATALPYWVAVARGYFKVANIDVEASNLMGSQPIVAAMITDQIDATTNLVTADAFNALTKKADLLDYISLNCQNAQYPLDAFMIRTGLDVTSVAGLKGKASRMVSTPGAGNVTGMRTILVSNGLTEGTDFSITELAPNLQVDALRAGSFDVAFVFEPFPTLMAEKGVARMLEGGVVASYEVGRKDACGFGAGGAVTQRFIKEKPDVARRYAAAWRRALADVNNDPTTRQLLVGNTATPPELVNKVVMPKLLMVSEMSPQNVEDLQKLFDYNVAHKVFAGSIDVKQYIVTLDQK
jgi:NitT/TauT family transport system substrate-binding protein